MHNAGNDPNLFTVVLEHNGFFCGLRDNLTYISGTVDYFDYCNTETFSLLWIEEFLRHFDYHFDGRLHVYWCKPGMELRHGLQSIEHDRDIVDMIRAVDVENSLTVLIDHTNFLRTLRDDVLHTRPPLPPVISPGEGTSSAIVMSCAGISSYEGEILQAREFESESDTSFDEGEYHTS
jgi:hypothetical protein